MGNLPLGNQRPPPRVSTVGVERAPEHETVSDKESGWSESLAQVLGMQTETSRVDVKPTGFPLGDFIV